MVHSSQHEGRTLWSMPPRDQDHLRRSSASRSPSPSPFASRTSEFNRGETPPSESLSYGALKARERSSIGLGHEEWVSDHMQAYPSAVRDAKRDRWAAALSGARDSPFKAGFPKALPRFPRPPRPESTAARSDSGPSGHHRAARVLQGLQLDAHAGHPRSIAKAAPGKTAGTTVLVIPEAQYADVGWRAGLPTGGRAERLLAGVWLAGVLGWWGRGVAGALALRLGFERLGALGGQKVRRRATAGLALAWAILVMLAARVFSRPVSRGPSRRPLPPP
jgi:hypothetical protein